MMAITASLSILTCNSSLTAFRFTAVKDSNYESAIALTNLSHKYIMYED